MWAPMKTSVIAATALAAVLGFACGGDDDVHSDHDAALADAGPTTDGAGADADATCSPSGVSAEAATRTTDAGTVVVSATLRNALARCAKEEVVFALVFDTHSLDLTAIDVRAASTVQTSLGGGVADLVWEPGSVSSHHVDGTLRGTAPPLSGASWLRLTVRDVAGTDRVFEWDETLLAHDLP